MDEKRLPKSPVLQAALNGKDEMNLAEFPIARLGRNDTRLTIEYTGQIVDKSGIVLEQKWQVSGNAKFGLPTEFADRVLVALMVISAKESFTDRKVPFTIYRVLKLLGLSHNQRNYAAVEKALQQLVGVTIYSEGAFWDHAQQKRVTTKKGFHVLEEFWLKSFEDDGSVAEAEGVNGYVVWGQRIWQSFQAGYIKNLDIEFYYSLENTLARRLFRFLDKRMHYQDTYQIDIFDLAARLGMKPYRYPSHLGRKLKPAFDELQDKEFLESAEIIKVGTYTRVRFVRSGTRRMQARLEDVIEAPVEAFEGTEEGTPVYPLSAPLELLYARYDTPDHLRRVWAAVLQEYERTLPAGTYTMIADSALLDVEDDVAVIAVTKRHRGWIERQMERQIRSLLNQHLKTDARIRALHFVEL